jgi:hypothetical protein
MVSFIDMKLYHNLSMNYYHDVTHNDTNVDNIHDDDEHIQKQDDTQHPIHSILRRIHVITTQWEGDDKSWWGHFYNLNIDKH